MSDTVNNPQDIAEILAVHHSWLESNNGLVPEKMYPNFANPGYLQFNLNGHQYNNVDEKVKLWEGLHQIGFNLTDVKIVEEPKVYAEGNLAYLTAYWSALATGDTGTGALEPAAEPLTFRVTEVYRRDDGTGKPVWRIWHFHASPVASPEAPRFPQDA
jgi:ketosteroid isomerase-like protein